MSIVYRACEARDLPFVRALMQQLADVAHTTEEFDVETMAATLGRMHQQPEVYFNLVAEDAGRVVGFISAVFYRSFFHSGGTALICELVVAREERGKGVGRALVLQVKDAAVARGFNEVEVGTESDNMAAQRFYWNCGFDQAYVLLGMELESQPDA